MSFFDRLFRRTKQKLSVSSVAKSKETAARSVTDCKLWKCPKCGELLEKGALGADWMPFEPITKVVGTGTCSKCGSTFAQSDIYGGRFDVETPLSSVKSHEQPRALSIVVFRIRSYQPPSDAKSYCHKVLATKFPSADMERNYIVGFADDLSTGEAFALYHEFVRKGQLPDLGRQIESFKGSGPGGDNIVALFFAGEKPENGDEKGRKQGSSLKITPKQEERERLISSDLLSGFVRNMNGAWNHQDWLGVLARVRRLGYSLLEDDEVGGLLEAEKKKYWCNRERVSQDKIPVKDQEKQLQAPDEKAHSVYEPTNVVDKDKFNNCRYGFVGYILSPSNEYFQLVCCRNKIVGRIHELPERTDLQLPEFEDNNIKPGVAYTSYTKGKEILNICFSCGYFLQRNSNI